MRCILLLATFTLSIMISGCVSWGDCSYYSNDNARQIEHDGLLREYIVYVPSSYDGKKEIPVVLNFHGYAGLASDYLKYADMRPQAEKDTFLLVYPQGACLNGFSHWNAALPGGDNKSDVDDIGFIRALLGDLNTDYNLDEERIYACGYSNGGMMSYALACYESDRIAAVGSISGALLDQSAACSPSHPIPIINLHGTSDDVLAYNGGSDFISVQSTIDFWVEFNEASKSAAIATDRNIEHQVYSNDMTGVSVEHYKYNGEGHIWFKNEYQGSNASQLVWDFFSKYDINGSRR